MYILSGDSLYYLIFILKIIKLTVKLVLYIYIKHYYLNLHLFLDLVIWL